MIYLAAMSRDKVLLLMNFFASVLVGTGVIVVVQRFSGEGIIDWGYAFILGIALGLGNSWRLYGRWRRSDSQPPVSKH